MERFWEVLWDQKIEIQMQQKETQETLSTLTFQYSSDKDHKTFVHGSLKPQFLPVLTLWSRLVDEIKRLPLQLKMRLILTEQPEPEQLSESDTEEGVVVSQKASSPFVPQGKKQGTKRKERKEKKEKKERKERKERKEGKEEREGKGEGQREKGSRPVLFKPRHHSSAAAKTNTKGTRARMTLKGSKGTEAEIFEEEQVWKGEFTHESNDPPELDQLDEPTDPEEQTQDFQQDFQTQSPDVSSDSQHQQSPQIDPGKGKDWSSLTLSLKPQIASNDRVLEFTQSPSSPSSPVLAQAAQAAQVQVRRGKTLGVKRKERTS